MNAGHVYVLAFDNGTVKVGQTQNASQRLNTHKSLARSLGLAVTDEWVSPLHVGWRTNEDALKAIAASLGGTPTSPEYFGGVDFAAVVEKAQELTFTTPEADTTPEHGTAESDAKNLAEPDWEIRPRTAREDAIRDVATEWVADAMADEVAFCRMFLDKNLGLYSELGKKLPARSQDVIRLILQREGEIGRHYDTVLAIQRRLSGSDA